MERAIAQDGVVGASQPRAGEGSPGQTGLRCGALLAGVRVVWKLTWGVAALIRAMSRPEELE